MFYLTYCTILPHPFPCGGEEGGPTPLCFCPILLFWRKGGGGGETSVTTDLLPSAYYLPTPPRLCGMYYPLLPATPPQLRGGHCIVWAAPFPREHSPHVKIQQCAITPSDYHACACVCYWEEEGGEAISVLKWRRKGLFNHYYDVPCLPLYFVAFITFSTLTLCLTQTMVPQPPSPLHATVLFCIIPGEGRILPLPHPICAWRLNSSSAPLACVCLLLGGWRREGPTVPHLTLPSCLRAILPTYLWRLVGGGGGGCHWCCQCGLGREGGGGRRLHRACGLAETLPVPVTFYLPFPFYPITPLPIRLGREEEEGLPWLPAVWPCTAAFPVPFPFYILPHGTLPACHYCLPETCHL